MYVPFRRRGYSYVRDDVIFLLLQRFMEDKKTRQDFVILIGNFINIYFISTNWPQKNGQKFKRYSTKPYTENKD